MIYDGWVMSWDWKYLDNVLTLCMWRAMELVWPRTRFINVPLAYHEIYIHACKNMGHK